MKKTLLTLVIVLLSLITFAQTDSSKNKFSYYVSLGIAVPVTDSFKKDSYSMIEGGIGYKNLCFGLAAGRGSNRGLLSKQDLINAYWYELKSYAYFPIGSVKTFTIIGAGNYFKSNHIFIEYGLGLDYNLYKNTDITLSISNWDKINYLSICLMQNF